MTDNTGLNRSNGSMCLQHTKENEDWEKCKFSV